MVREALAFVWPDLPAGCSMGSRMHMSGFGVYHALSL
jgi:hypothetical protein